MDEVVGGIRETDLGTLSFEILDYADRIMDIFLKIDNKMESLSDYYQGDSFDELNEYYSLLKSNYDAVKSNIVSYSDDLVELIRKMHETDSRIANIFEEFSKDTNNNLESIEDRR